MGFCRSTRNPYNCCFSTVSHEEMRKASQELCKGGIVQNMIDIQTSWTCRFLPPSTTILGYARSKLSDQNVRDKVKPFLRDEPNVVQDFLKLITYLPGAYDNADDFKKLDEELKKREDSAKGSVGRLFYLALPPSVYPQVCLFVSSNSFHGPHTWSKSLNIPCLNTCLDRITSFDLSSDDTPSEIGKSRLTYCEPLLPWHKFSLLH